MAHQIHSFGYSDRSIGPDVPVTVELGATHCRVAGPRSHAAPALIAIPTRSATFRIDVCVHPISAMTLIAASTICVRRAVRVKVADSLALGRMT
jgi:hypothetical protein